MNKKVQNPSRSIALTTALAAVSVASFVVTPNPAAADLFKVCKPNIRLVNNSNQPISVKYIRAGEVGDSTLNRQGFKDIQLNPNQSYTHQEPMMGLEGKPFRMQAVYDSKGGERQGYIQNYPACRDGRTYKLYVQAPAQQPTGPDLFKTENEARNRAKELKKCKKAHQVGSYWRPCRSASEYQKAISNQ